MSTEVIAPTSSSPTKGNDVLPSSEQSEPVTNMDTSIPDVEPTATTTEETPVNGVEETTGSKRKRSTKKSVEIDETSISNARPRRTLPKRDEPTPVVNGTGKSNKIKAEQAAADADDEQEREKNIPIVHDVADVVWVKMGGHPWWPSLILRDPNDPTRCFTKITGNARSKRMYFVVFYGSTADFAWVPDSAIIPYEGVEAFTKYAQESVDKAVTKSQKEQLTERFQLKVTISRREDWESAVREADESIKQLSETRLEEIEPKIQFYTAKLAPGKGQSNRKSKILANKIEDSSEPPSAPTSSIDPNDGLAIESKSEDDSSNNDDDDDYNAESSARKTSAVKIKLKKQSSDNSDTPPAKRRYVRKSTGTNESGTVTGQTTTNGSYETPTVNGNSSVKKRGRPRLSKPSVITNNGEASPIPKKSITKPQAFTNKSHPVSSSLNNILVGQHHRFDTRIGFLSPFEEQEIFDVINQLRSTKTFEEAEQLARNRFEQILCLNLNKTHVDIPQEWFYSFLFAHPILIVKNTHWFNEKKSSDLLNDTEILNNINRTQSTSSVQVLKHQLEILSKLYRNELQNRSTNNKEENV